MKKYEFTGATKNIDGHILHQIRALIDFGNVAVGDLGGGIESEKNLSQEGNCWVYDNATVCGDARIYGNARIRGNAEVYGDTRVCGTQDIFWISCIGSRGDTTTFFQTQKGQIYVCCGCFRGTIDEFETKVNATHGGNMHAEMYHLAIQMAKLKLGCG